MTVAERRDAGAATASTAEPLHRRLGLSDLELDAIEERLGRTPNDLELAMFSVMWSEHCSYKSSRPLLRTLPTEGDDVIVGPGGNAGVVRIGDGLAVCFKIESHNHPSAVEPYQGAATGVGGILRDIVAMGARPVAVLDALRFGDPASPRTRHLVDGVVRGIAGYGNCIGIPTVGGELVFHPSYARNPLVNVMAIGIVAERDLQDARADRPGDLCVLFGSATGRDGIGGASVLASATFGEEQAAKRPTVQVGDPFAGKLLLEATLELVARRLVAGLQDLGAAGLTCATSETADRGGTGIVVDLDAVPRREDGMVPAEVMLSESQERMLAIVRPDRLHEVLAVCRHWGLPAAVVGRVTDDGDVTVVEGGVGSDGRPAAGARELARIPARLLASEAIVLEHEARPPSRIRQAPAPGAPDLVHDGLPERGMDPGAVLLALLGSPDLASRAWVTTRYDATVGTDTVAGPERGAAVLRIKGSRKGLVAATDGCERVALFDPALGAAMAVAECVRNVVITGARPLGITDGLNMGDPGRPEGFWQLRESVRGLGEACRALGVPVVGGNVSLFNESPAGAIAPTVQVGVVGLLDDVTERVGQAFPSGDLAVALAGDSTPGLAGSRYADLAGTAPEDRPPGLDLAAEAALHRFLADAIGRRLVRSAQDVSGGGLAVTLAECAIWGDTGADLVVPVAGPPAVELFGESPSRVVLTVGADDRATVDELAGWCGVPLRWLGTTGSDRLRIRLSGEGATGAAEGRGASVADEIDVAVAALRHAWQIGLPRALGAEVR